MTTSTYGDLSVQNGGATSEMPVAHRVTSAAPTPAGGHDHLPRPEDPKRHPLAYGALALALLATILSIIALTRSGGPTTQHVVVGHSDCVTVNGSRGAATLYCQTGALPQ